MSKFQCNFKLPNIKRNSKLKNKMAWNEFHITIEIIFFLIQKFFLFKIYIYLQNFNYRWLKTRHIVYFAADWKIPSLIKKLRKARSKGLLLHCELSNDTIQSTDLFDS